MTNRFTDKAANERNFLARVRTVLSIAGFGLLIEKLAPAGTTQNWFAPALVALSAFLLSFATIHFELTRRMISDNDQDDPRHVWSERLLVGMVIGLVGAVFVFLAGLL